PSHANSHLASAGLTECETLPACGAWRLALTIDARGNHASSHAGCIGGVVRLLPALRHRECIEGCSHEAHWRGGEYAGGHHDRRDEQCPLLSRGCRPAAHVPGAVRARSALGRGPTPG